MKTKKTIHVMPSAIAKVKKAGAKIVKLWITPLSHISYEGARKSKRDYLYGVRAECDTVDLLCLVQ